MTKTFIQLKPGDIVYYVVVEKSAFVTKGEIKTAVIKEIQESNIPYQLCIKLNNDSVFVVENWNTSITKEPIYNDERTKAKHSIAEPCYFRMYSPDEHELKRAIKDYIDKKIEILNELSVDIQKELINLSTMKTIASSLIVKKVEEVVLEPTVV